MPQELRGNGDGLYLTLEVLPGASHDEIARAYRRLAHDAHPDTHPGDPEASRRFREITEAYEVLANPGKRERYDRARRRGHMGTDRPSQAAAEARPGSTQIFASPPANGGPPVFLGTEPVTKPFFQLSVGPVQVRPSRSGRPTSLTQEDVAAALLARLLSDIFEPGWRP